MSGDEIREQLAAIERVARATPEPSPALLRLAQALRRLGCFVNTTEDDAAALAPLSLRIEGERVVADVEFDARYEGNRGQVHGGFVAAGFDIVAVSAARLSGSAGPTGTLSVRFVAPTPLATPLRYEAWLEGREGRKLRVRGRLARRDDRAVSAELDAIVIATS
jgi:acyl-coenzyme A thioesterase PaaI-like protein